MALMLAPAKPLCLTSNGESCTWNWSMASRLMGVPPVWPPFVPDAARPNTSLFTAPSIEMALNLLFVPRIEIPPSPVPVA